MKRYPIRNLGLGILLGLAAFSTEAKLFQTKFIKVELPPNWDCKKEELDYVCQPDNLAEKSEVVLIIVAKAVNEIDDTLEKYKGVLAVGRPMRNLLGTSYTAEVKYVREKKILDRVWIDSLHRGSEIPGFFSRYLASINEKIAGLITYSIAESVYPKWASVMDQMVESLVLTYDAKAFEEAMNAAAKIGDDALARSSGGVVVPESFTHGSSAQRQRWFDNGLKNGSVKACDTFTAKNL